MARDLETVGQGCLEIAVVNLGTNQIQTNTLFGNVCVFFIRYEMKAVWKCKSG